MGQNQIQITSIDDLVNFIDEVDISFNDYIKIANAYFGVPFYWLGAGCKKTLIARIKELPTTSTDVLPIILNIKKDKF